MKMKLLDLAGKVITIKSDQKKAKRCYESNLKTKRGVVMVTTRAPPRTEEVAHPEINHEEVVRGSERKEHNPLLPPEPIGDAGEREIGGKVSKLGNAPKQTAEDQIAKVRLVHQRAKEHLALEELFTTIAKYRLKLDPEKCMSGIEAGKFLGFLLTERGIEANPERRMVALSGFMSSGEGKGHPYSQCVWIQCKEAFIRLKEYLDNPSVLCKVQPSTPLRLYLTDQAISSIIVQEQDQFQKLICFVSKV